MSRKTKREARLTRHRRVRRKIRGTPERPRLAVYRSLRHFSAQVIDDIAGKTLFAIASSSREVRKAIPKPSTVQAAGELGKIFGERLKSEGITRVVFDRGGSLYHGRVKAFADGAREAGIEI